MVIPIFILTSDFFRVFPVLFLHFSLFTLLSGTVDSGVGVDKGCADDGLLICAVNVRKGIIDRFDTSTVSKVVIVVVVIVL